MEVNTLAQYGNDVKAHYENEIKQSLVSFVENNLELNHFTINDDKVSVSFEIDGMKVNQEFSTPNYLKSEVLTETYFDLSEAVKKFTIDALFENNLITGQLYPTKIEHTLNKKPKHTP